MKPSLHLLTLVISAMLSGVAVASPQCPADTNNDGVFDNGDISTFISLFLASDPAADFNGDGITDNGDINAFISQFLAGECGARAIQPMGAGWNANDGTTAGRHFGLRGSDLAAPTVFQSPDDFTVIIPFYFDPFEISSLWEYHLISGGNNQGTHRSFRWFVKAADDTTGVSVQFESGSALRAVSTSNAALEPGTHYMAVWTYRHAGGEHTLYLFKQGSAQPVASGSRTGLPLDAWAATDQLCLGNYSADGLNNVSIALDSPVLGVVCRKGTLDQSQLEAIWNGGTAPNYRDLFPSPVKDMAWAVGLVNEHFAYSFGTLKTYQPWDPDKDTGRIQSWDERLGIGGSTWVQVKSNLIDVVNANSASAHANSSVRNADFLDPDSPEGGFWQPGQPTHPNTHTNIPGVLPMFSEVLAGTRAGNTPMFLGSLGNSRTALVGTGPADENDTRGAPRSLAYGFVRARPERFGGIILGHLNQNTNASISFMDRHLEGDPPATSDTNKNRMGFGSTTAGSLVDGPGRVYQLLDSDVLEFRLDARDPLTDSTRNTQPVVVLARRPGAGTVAAHATKADSRTSNAGTAVGADSPPVNLDTTVESSTLDDAVIDGETLIVVAGDHSDWVGWLVNFEADDDLAYVDAFLGFDGISSTLSLKHPLLGTKPQGSAVHAGPLRFQTLGAGALAEITEPDTANYMRGVRVTAVGHIEIIAGGYYFTDKPNAICMTVMGHGGHGEGNQVADEFTRALATYLDDFGMDGLLLCYATQNITDLNQHLEDRLGPMADTLEIIGAPEGAYAASSFLVDNAFTLADSGARVFAAARSNVALYPIYETAYDFVSAAYAGFLSDGAHQSPFGSIFRNSLLWDAIEANPPD